jgi:hypothetical protein
MRFEKAIVALRDDVEKRIADPDQIEFRHT